MRFHVLTLFPQMIQNGLSESIIGRALEKELFSVDTIDIRDFSKDKHKKADDYPYGGGAGLLMLAQPVHDAYQSIVDKVGKKPRTIYLTPQGKVFNQRMAEEFSKEDDLVFLCGHYEGIDERVLEEVVTDYISLGDFVVTGGELPAMMMIDTISRLLPDVLHNDSSAKEESFSGYLLEYPQYTRPEVFMGKQVPEVLLSGDHKKIRAWRLQEAIKRTKERRPDLYDEYQEIMLCRDILMKNKLHHMDMIELINRGQAKLCYHKERTILLFDRISEVYMLTATDEEAGIAALKSTFTHSKNRSDVHKMVSHQEFMNPFISEFFSMPCVIECFQEVYTRKEALPKSKFKIEKLSLDYLEQISNVYHGESKEYLKNRIEVGAMYGVFQQNQLAGFIGEHKEGSMGILYVFEEYRNHGIAYALESDLVNRSLLEGKIPYGQVKVGNEKSMKLQEKVGFYVSKEKLWWFES